MAYSNQTSNYGLPLPTDSDKSTWTDNNTAFQAIDSALHNNVVATVSFSSALSSLAARVTALENTSFSGYVKYSASGTGLTNTEYGKLTIES